jgi:hypothetical protein
VRRHTVIVPVAGLHRGVLKAVQYAQILGGDLHVVAVEIDPQETAKLLARWQEVLPEMRLEVLPSPYRSVIAPLLEFIDRFVQEGGDYATLVLPEFVSARWWHHLLHNQTALALKVAMLFERQIDDTVGDDDIHATIGHRQVLDLSQAELDVRGPYLACIGPRPLDHVRRHVHADDMSLRPNSLRRQEAVNATPGAKVQHRLARLQ